MLRFVVFMLRAVMLSVIMLKERRKERGAVMLSLGKLILLMLENDFAECHWSECRYAECRGATNTSRQQSLI
jgi:hypothetical protein